MKHASLVALEKLTNLLDEIRRRPGLKEKKFGIFYLKAKSFIHFHEDPKGLFADMSTSDGFDRFPVNTTSDHRQFLAAVDRALRSQQVSS